MSVKAKHAPAENKEARALSLPQDVLDCAIDVIHELNRIALEYDSYEYGLPIRVGNDSQTELMCRGAGERIEKLLRARAGIGSK